MTTWAPISGTFPHFGMSTLSYCPLHISDSTLLEAARWVDPALGFAVGWVRCQNIPYRLSKVALRTIFIPMRALHYEFLSELTYVIVYPRPWKSRLLFFFYLSGTPM
jgi:hypothetical protein